MNDADKKTMDDLEAELAFCDPVASIEAIGRCQQRLIRLVELDAPMCIIEREVAMIQYRALTTLLNCEATKELKSKLKGMT